MNRNVQRRDEILFGGYDPNRYKYGGYKRILIPYNKMKMIVDEGFIDLNECQNDSPTTKDFLELAEDFKDDILFDVYAISPDRDDYRVTIIGVHLDIPLEDTDRISYAVEQLRYADEFNIYAYKELYHIRAWWD